MLIPQIMAHGVQNFVLLAIPFFILAGNIMNCGGMTERIFKFASSIIGHAQRGIGSGGYVASLDLWRDLPGSALADAAGLGTVTVKAMDDAGYSRKFGAGLTLAAATMDPIIPPSIHDGHLCLYGKRLHRPSLLWRHFTRGSHGTHPHGSKSTTWSPRKGDTVLPMCGKDSVRSRVEGADFLRHHRTLGDPLRDVRGGRYHDGGGLIGNGLLLCCGD